MIKIDYREEKSGIIELFKNSEIVFQVEQLKYGDYIIDNNLAIERKTADDFVISIIDGRLFRQIINLTKYFDYKCLIIEGNPFKTQFNFNRNALEGAFVEISIMLGVPVMFTKSLQDTFERIVLINNNFQRKRCYLIKRCGRKPKNFSRKILYILQGLPNIGKIKSKKLLEHFGSIKNLANATEEELKEVEGIDTVIAKLIFDILTQTIK